MVKEKECPGYITLAHNGKHRPMVPIESDVKKIKLELDEFISSNHTAFLQSLNILKLKYDTNLLDMMKYLEELSAHVKDFD